MAINAGTINANINIRYQEFERGMNRVTQRFNLLGRNMQNNMNSIGHTSANLNNSITSLGNNTSNAVGNMQNNLNRLNQTNNNIANQTARNTRNMQSSFDKLNQASSSIAGLGIGAGITALGAESINTVKDFDDIMARVKATTGATNEEFEKLRNQAIDLGATTAWSASQSAEGMTYLAMAGWDVNQIYDAMPGMLALASAGALDLGRAADIASDVMTAMGMEASEAGHMADVLAKAATSSNTSVELLGETMKYVAPVAHTFGASLEDTTAIAAKMADAGIKGSMSGTALRMGLNRLAAPTKNAQKWLDQLGVATTDASGNMRDITDIIRDLEVGMDKLSNSERIQATSKIFGVEAMSAWLAAIDTGADSIEDLSDKLVNSNGYALETAAIMEDTLGGAFRALSGAWESLMISFGDVMKPVVIKIAEWLQLIVRWFNNLSPTTKKVIVVILALVAGLALLLGLIAPLGFLIEGVVLLATALPAIGGALATIAGPVLLVIGIIAALIALGYGLYKAWNENLWGIQDKFASFKEWIASTVKEIISIWNNFLDIFKSDGAENALSYMENVFKDKFGSIFNWLESKFPNLSAYFGLVWQHLKENADKIIGVVSELAGKIKDHFLELMGIPGKFIKAWQDEGPEKAFEYLGKAIADSIYRIFDINKTIIDSGKTIGDTILSFYTKNKKELTKILNGLLESGKNAFNDLKEWFVDGWKAAFDSSKESFSNFFDFISDNWYKIFDIFDWGTAFIKGFIDELLLKFFNFDGGISGVIDNIKEIFSNWISGLIEDGKQIMENIAEGIKKYANLPKEALEEALAKLRNLLPSSDAKEGPLSQLTHNGEKIPGTLAEGVAKGKANLLNAMNDSLQEVRDSISINGQMGLTATANAGMLPTDLITEPTKQETNHNDNRTINVYALNKDELLELLEDILDDEMKSNL